MGQTKHSYIIRLEAQGGKVVSAELQRMGTDGEKSFKRLSDAAANTDSRLSLLTRTMLTRFLPVFSTAALGRSMFNNIQAFERLDNRIKFLTDTTEDYTKAQEFLRKTSRELHTDILALSDGYARLLALKKGGILDDSEVEKLLVGLSNAKAALGANETQFGQVLYGLAQALTQGRVQAQEFNQVIEPMPGLMQAIDKAAGVAAGGFRQMIKDGDVTGEMFAEVLIKALQEYEGAAASMGETSVGAVTDLKNAWFDLGKTMVESGYGEKLAEILGLLKGIVDFTNEAIKGARILIDPQKLDRLRSLNYDIAKLQADKDPRGFHFGIDALGDVNESMHNTRLKGLQKERQKILDEMMDAEAAAARAKAYKDQYEAGNKLLEDGPYMPGTLTKVPVPTAKPQEIYDKAFKEQEKAEKEAIKTAQQHADAIRTVTEGLQFRNDQLTRGTKEQELYNQLQAAGVELNSREGQEIARLVEEWDALTKQLEKTKKETEALNRAADEIGDAFSSAFERATFEGENFSDMLESLGNDILRTLYRTVIGDPLSEAVSGIAKDVLPDLLDFIPWRDSGGPVTAGSPYKVGVPEIFIPSNSGTAIPLDKLPGGGSVQVNVMNYGAPDKVQVRETKRGGDLTLDVIIDKTVSGLVNQPGSQTNRALRQFGSTTVTRR